MCDGWHSEVAIELQYASWSHSKTTINGKRDNAVLNSCVFDRTYTYADQHKKVSVRTDEIRESETSHPH